MNHRDRWPIALLALLLLAYVGLAGWYSLVIPLGEAPDEVPHFTYVRYLAQHGRLPDTSEEHEAFQPPLYYAAAAALTFWIEDDPDAPFAVRHNAYYDVADPRSPKNLLLHTAGESWPFRGWALAWHLELVAAEEIDRLNILQATLLAMRRAVQALSLVPDLVLVDGNRCPAWQYSSVAVVKGDALVAAISAASVVREKRSPPSSSPSPPASLSLLAFLVGN